MRKLFAVAMAAGLVGLGGSVRDANAGMTIDLLFTQINGGNIAATDTLGLGALNPGDQVTMAAMVTNDEPITAIIFSLNYDLALENGLDVVSVNQWLGVALNMAGTDRFQPLGALSPTIESGPGSVGFAGSFQGTTTNLSLPRTLPAGSYQMGTVTWHYTGNATQDIDIISGLLNFGIDVTGDATFANMDARTVFNGATILVPEPGTAALLGLGLMGLVVAGRRNRA